MRKITAVFAAMLVCLVGLDLAVAATLGWAERNQRLGSLVRYFEYGRSVPGKLEKWLETPGARGNLFEVAWLPDLVVTSTARFRNEAPDIGPVVRSYGMSFVDNILHSAGKQDLDMILDRHSGPGAPPNFALAVFEADRANRRAGDTVVLGVLASAVPAMGALSNSTWAFEQPAPFTYPVYHAEGDALRRVDPLVQSAADQRRALTDVVASEAWRQHLAEVDAFYDIRTFGARWMDASPFLRLVRRSLAISYIEQQKARILQGDVYPYTEVLPRMLLQFAQTARADGQIPVVFLIQTRDPRDVDVLAAAKEVLEANDIPYLATAEHFDPRNPAGFRGDGHYRPEIDAAFAKAFLDLQAELVR